MIKTFFLILAALLAGEFASADAKPYQDFDRVVILKSTGFLSDDGEIQMFLKQGKLYFRACPVTGCEILGLASGYDAKTTLENAGRIARGRGQKLGLTDILIAGMAGFETMNEVGGLASPGVQDLSNITTLCSLAVASSTLLRTLRESKCYRALGEALTELKTGETKVLRVTTRVPLRSLREHLFLLLK